jgi:hypothetical protein
MAFARYGAFWSNQKMERVAGDAFFFFLLVPWPATAHLPLGSLSTKNPYLFRLDHIAPLVKSEDGR